jgi:all-trans-retinol dehydrogenase (NAD+)
MGLIFLVCIAAAVLFAWNVLLYMYRTVYRSTKIAGSTVLITGAGSGIGRLMAVECAARGAKHLVLCDINEKSVDQTALLITATSSVNVKTFIVDVSDEKSVSEFKGRVDKLGYEIDILINNAGIVCGKPLCDGSLSPNMALRTLKVNAFSNFISLHAFLPTMVKRKKGHIVTIASTMGMMSAPMLSDYNASKAAQIAMHNAVRLELIERCPEIRTLLVCPHQINTGMFNGCNTSPSLSARISRMLVPELEPDFVSTRVLDGIENGDSWIVTPILVRFLPLVLQLFPMEIFHWICGSLGVHEAMKTFKGRPGPAEKKRE